MYQRVVYPFTALIGQDKMKKGLLLNAINPQLGGILVRGEKGTAKSTAVRALAALLPEIEVVVGCPFSCDPRAPGWFCEFCRAQFFRLALISPELRVFQTPFQIGRASCRERV